MKPDRLPRRRVPSAAICGALLLCLVPGMLSAQSGRTVRGVVLEAIRDTPVAGAEVSVEPDGPTVVTDEDGRFRVVVSSSLAFTLRVSALGYTPVTIDIPAGTDQHEVRAHLSAAPFELDSIQVSVLSYEERLAAVERHLEGRLERLSGQFRSVDRETLQGFEATHDSDPLRFITESLDASWGGMAPGGGDQIWIFARRVSPQVYIDEQRRHWFQLLETRPGTLCRLEIYVPPRYTFRLDEKPEQIRAYTCSYLARVVDGEVPVARYLQERLIAGDP